MATLVALSGAVLGLLAASLPDGHLSSAGTSFFCAAVFFFALALLVATQLAIRVGFAATRLGGRLETIPEVDISEFEAYLKQEFQEAEPTDLRRRVLPVMSSAISSRRRNVARKERCLDVASRLVGCGVLAGVAYAAILAL